MNHPEMISAEEFYNTYFENPNTVSTALDTIGIPDTLITNDILDFQKIDGFLHFNLTPVSFLELFMGSRYDYISFTGVENISPRFGMQWKLSPVLNFNLAAGRYFQAPFNYHLNSERGTTEDLKNYYADQVVGGIEYFPHADTRITLEYYVKDYADMVTFEMLEGTDSKDSVNIYNLINGGKGKSSGIEFFVQKKYSNNWYGSFSWSHSISEGVDPRTKEYYPWDYDYRNVVNLVGGYKIRYSEFDWYTSYKESFWGKSLLWLPFMPSDEYEISIKYRYMGGRPYTSKKYDHNTRNWYVRSDEPWNTERYDAYMRLDIMLQQRFNFKKMNLVAFWNIANVFNRQNPWEYIYLDDGTIEMSWQFQTFPVGGLILEF